MPGYTNGGKRVDFGKKHIMPKVGDRVSGETEVQGPLEKGLPWDNPVGKGGNRAPRT